MQITLKKTEIVEALKMYVQRQGLSLAGKTVEVSFTAGRGETGLIAELAIEDTELPPLIQTDLDFKDARNCLKVVADSPNPAPASAPSPETPNTVVVKGEPEEGEPAPVKASSLFG